uniref:DUF4537 domain-containing protein n=1 Tax=Poecilia formosa TaxID=48698 RepID=A0A096LRH1_POEFO
IKLEADLVQVLTGNPGCNVIYVLDVSERARAVLGSVKRLLIQTLLAKASLGDSLFNMVGFSNTVHCWSLHMLPCLPNTVFTAFPWVHSVSCSLGRHLLAALKAALSDPACHAVHLLCTDLLEQPGLLLRFLSALETCRPINVFYLQGPSSGLERSARDYLLCLSQATRGSCYLIMFDLEGNLEKVGQPSTPASQTKCSHSASTIKYQPTSPALSFKKVHLQTLVPSSCRCRPSVGEFSSGSCVLCGPAVAGSEFFPGHRVLARRQADGLFYPGSVIQEVQMQTQDCKGLWVVEFDRGGSAASSQRELVCSLDLVVDSRGHNHRLVPGDFVLSPWESDLRRYGPGRVVAVAPHRADVVADLQVLMWNSSVSLVPDSLVLPV